MDQGDHRHFGDDPPDPSLAFGLRSRKSLLSEEADRGIITANAGMFSDIGQNTRKRTNTQCVVTRNGDVMLTIFLSRQTHVTTALPYNLIGVTPLWWTGSY